MATERDRIRDAIKGSLFSKVTNGVLEESYIEHVQIFESDQGGIKSRFILLSRTKDGTGLIHKSKQNNNGTFSIGKTWKLLELRAVEVPDPLVFNITLSRTYSWRTQDETEQLNFIHTLVNFFREVTNGRTPLQLIGITVPNRATGSRPRVTEENGYSSRSGTPVGSVMSSRRRGDQFGPGSPPSRGVASQPRIVSPLPPASTFSQSAAGSPPKGQSRSRPSSPGVSSSRPRRAASPARNRPMSPSAGSAAGDIQTPIAQRPSNSVYSALSSRYSSSTTVTVPTIMSPPPDNGSRFNAESRVRKQPSQKLGHSSRPSLEIPMPNYAHPQGPSHLPSPISAYASESQSMSRNRPVSPAPSSSSRKSQGKQAVQNNTPPPTAPQIEKTVSQPRRDPNARISFFDPTNQVIIDRLLSTTITSEDGTEVEEETAQATLTNIEEMLEGYEWASEDIISKKRTKGAADMVESRLLDELLALDKANIHSFLEADDRINTVLKFIDDAVAELDTMDSLVSSYKIHLNAVNDDISFIQSQNRGLQVQTQNQVALLGELEKLLQTVHVNRETLIALTQESLEKSQSIQRLEEASGELYKALLAGRDNDMAATMERLDEYRTHNQQFCKRMLDFLTIMFTAQSNILLRSNGGIEKGNNGRPVMLNHQEIESYLGRYSGLMLYLKEMDEDKYAKVCATYFSAASELHSKQMKALFGAYTSLLKKSPEEDIEQGFGPTPTSAGFRSAGLRRNGTLRDGKAKDKRDGGSLSPPEALSIIFEQSAPQVFREGEFIADFLQINDAALTYADYLGLDQYFRRQASRSAGLSSSTAKLVRGAMDLIFGFFPAEFKTWVDTVLNGDQLQIIGIMACVERATIDADERGNTFFARMLDKQQQRLKGVFDRHVDEQVKSVEETKLTSKKRKGVAHFIKYFPIYISRVESQLVGADTLEIRNSVDAAYDRIVQSMFDSLKQMAKLDGEGGEDKGQLNYHVILIENMHFFVAEIQQQDIPAVNSFRKRAETIYDESLSAYVKLVLRRPFSKIIDFFEGVERLLRNTAPSEVSKNSNYNRSSLKRVVKEYTTKDIRKHVDALFKRVEKHYTEASDNATTESSSGIAPGTVLVGVWKACEEELIRITNLFSQRISQCYGDTSVSLEYNVSDVEAAFKRHRVGS